MDTYNPDAQREICGSPSLCFFGDFPTIATISKNYGIKTSVAWLIPQLLDLSEFCGCKEKLQGRPLESTAWLIAQNYYYLKVSELMLFFSRFKQGKYGRFYGSVDPLIIMSALIDFVRERNDAIFDRDCELNQIHDEKGKKDAISHEEYLRLKKITTLKSKEK